MHDIAAQVSNFINLDIITVLYLLFVDNIILFLHNLK